MKRKGWRVSPFSWLRKPVKTWKLSKEMTAYIYDDGSMLAHSNDGRYRLTEKELRRLYSRLFYRWHRTEAKK